MSVESFGGKREVDPEILAYQTGLQNLKDRIEDDPEFVPGQFAAYRAQLAGEGGEVTPEGFARYVAENHEVIVPTSMTPPEEENLHPAHRYIIDRLEVFARTALQEKSLES